MPSMEDKYDVSIRKIPIQSLIDVLVELYNRGVDYVDIVGSQGDLQDAMSITFTKDYMTEQGKEYFKDVVDDEEIDLSNLDKLSDEDLNDLI
jgi:hypothetical protein